MTFVLGQLLSIFVSLSSIFCLLSLLSKVFHSFSPAVEDDIEGNDDGKDSSVDLTAGNDLVLQMRYDVAKDWDHFAATYVTQIKAKFALLESAVKKQS